MMVFQYIYSILKRIRNKKVYHGLRIIYGSLLILVGLLITPTTMAQDNSIAIAAVEIPLNKENPAQKKIGRLTYIKGYHLTSNHKGFAGISGLTTETSILLPQGQTVNNFIPSSGPGLHTTVPPCLLFVTDAAYFGKICLNHDYTIQQKSFFLKNRFLPRGIHTQKNGDAEAISFIKGPSAANGYLVSYEQKPAIMAHISPSAAITSITQKPVSLPLPSNIDLMGSNAGLEALEMLSDGRLFMMAENPTIKTRQYLAWVGTARDTIQTMTYEAYLAAPPPGYSPTDATELPNGDILVLLRRLSYDGRFRIKFWYIEKASLFGGGLIKGKVIATLEHPLTVDNMEGLALAGTSSAGNPVIAVISDNNFSRFQRTLLLFFELIP